LTLDVFTHGIDLDEKGEEESIGQGNSWMTGNG
jgi:hypothetical protein